MLVLDEWILDVCKLVQVLRSVEALGEGPDHGVLNVRCDLPADEVDELEGAHGQTNGRESLLNGGKRGSLVERACCLAHDLCEETVDDEAGAVCRDDGALAELACNDHRGREALIVCAVNLHNLDEWHHCNRVEEVEADEAFRVLQVCADLGHAE